MEIQKYVFKSCSLCRWSYFINGLLKFTYVLVKDRIELTILTIGRSTIGGWAKVVGNHTNLMHLCYCLIWLLFMVIGTKIELQFSFKMQNYFFLILTVIVRHVKKKPISLNIFQYICFWFNYHLYKSLTKTQLRVLVLNWLFLLFSNFVVD